MAAATLKLFAGLDKAAQAVCSNHAARIELKPGTTIADIIADAGLTERQCHLVLLNGNFIAPGERGRVTVDADDVLSIWPPIGGG